MHTHTHNDGCIHFCDNRVEVDVENKRVSIIIAQARKLDSEVFFAWNDYTIRPAQIIFITMDMCSVN